MSGKTFANNWQYYKDLNDEYFGTPTYQEVMLDSALWQIASSHTCVLRVENKRTGLIKEYSYKTDFGAANKIIELADDYENVITVADNETIHLLKYPDDYEPPV